MTLSRTVSSDEDPRTFAEERRLVLLLGSTSILFLVCVSPMVILNVTLSEGNLSSYPYQVSEYPLIKINRIYQSRKPQNPRKGLHWGRSYFGVARNHPRNFVSPLT